MIFEAIFLLLLISGIVAEDAGGVTLSPKTSRDAPPGAEGNGNHAITNDGVFDTGPTGTDLGNVTKIDMKPERTTIPETDIEEALNLDYGRYTPMNFQYHNEQNFFQNDQQSDECTNMWIKCLLSLSNIQKICALHDVAQANHRGLTKYDNFCDMQYDNCRNYYRLWRVVDTRICWRYNWSDYIEFWLPERRLNNIWDFLKPKNSL